MQETPLINLEREVDTNDIANREIKQADLSHAEKREHERFHSAGIGDVFAMFLGFCEKSAAIVKKVTNSIASVFVEKK